MPRPRQAGIAKQTKAVDPQLSPPAHGTRHPAWADTFGADRYGIFAGVVAKGVEYRFRLVPPGRAWLGTEKVRSELAPLIPEPFHEVHLEKELWVGEVPCTQAFYYAVTGENPSRFSDSPECPIENVSWKQCQSFLTELNRQHPRLLARLPTEDEWEYTCRAGTTTETYAGDLDVIGERNAPMLDEIAWYGGNSGTEHPRGSDTKAWRERQFPHSKAGTQSVGQKRPNPWGFYDCLGNVWEWCAHSGRSGSRRLLRGGSWSSAARRVRAAFRRASTARQHDGHTGFRLARGPGLLTEEQGETT